MNPTRTRALLATAVSAAALAAGASGASAATYCVPTCTTPGVTPEPNLDSALADATNAGGVDDVLLAAGTFYTEGFAVPGGPNAIRIKGVSPAKTRIVANDALSQLAFGDGSSIAQARLENPSGGTPLKLAPGSLGAGIDVAMSSAASPAVIMDGGTLADSTVEAPVDPEGIGVYAPHGAGGIALDRDRIRAGHGIALHDLTSGSTVRRTRVESRIGIEASCSNLTVEDSLVHAIGGSAWGIQAWTGQSCQGAWKFAAVKQSTLVSDASSSTGIEALGDGARQSMQVSNTIVDGFETSIYRRAETGHVDFETDWSAYDQSTVANVEAGPDPGSLVQSHPIASQPGFVNRAKGRYALRYDSPLIEAGLPGKLGLLESEFDLRGEGRLVDGDADGTATRDVGAFEYERRPPLGSASSTPTVGVGRRASFDSHAFDPDPGDALELKWSFGDGNTATGAHPRHAYAKPGTYGWTLTATDPTGQKTAFKGVVAVVPRPKLALSAPDIEKPLAKPLHVLAKASRPLKLAARARLTIKGVADPIVLKGATIKKLAGGGSRVSIALTRKARRALRKHGRGVATVRVSGRDKYGQLATAKRKVGLRAG